jgi:hypothetical protein
MIDRRSEFGAHNADETHDADKTKKEAGEATRALEAPRAVGQASDRREAREPAKR